MSSWLALELELEQVTGHLASDGSMDGRTPTLPAADTVSLGVEKTHLGQHERNKRRREKATRDWRIVMMMVAVVAAVAVEGIQSHRDAFQLPTPTNGNRARKDQPHLPAHWTSSALQAAAPRRFR